MKSKRLTPCRYQLNKQSSNLLVSGHPWIFRSHLSSAVKPFNQGQWLKLYNSENEIIGYGVYEDQGLIGIRVLKRGPTAPTLNWIEKVLIKSLIKRDSLRKYTNAFRAVHGENDGMPGIVVDVYQDSAVLQTYSSAVDSLGRYVAMRIKQILGLKNLMWKFPTKRMKVVRSENLRVLAGVLPRLVQFREGAMNFSVTFSGAQKSGAFLDLRGLRKWVSLQKLHGTRVLNLFSYTGMLGLASEIAGAPEIWNVDISKGASEFAKAHHCIHKNHQQYFTENIFEWIGKLSSNRKFDLIIVDPPQMAIKKSHVPIALKTYHKLYRTCLNFLAPRGQLVACCCTSRIPRKVFATEIEKTVGKKLKLKHSIFPDPDHPVAFPEGDYLKSLIFG